MIAKISCFTALVSVLLAALMGLVAVWFENILPAEFLTRSLTTCSIVFVAALVIAVVNLFMPPTAAPPRVVNNSITTTKK
jgi:hypothetical protein